MKQLLSKIGVVGLMVVIAVASFSLSTQAAEKKKITYSKKLQKTITFSRNMVYPGDVPNHEIDQHVNLNIITWSDPDFGETEVMLYGVSDSTAGGGILAQEDEVSLQAKQSTRYCFNGEIGRSVHVNLQSYV